MGYSVGSTWVKGQLLITLTFHWWKLQGSRKRYSLWHQSWLVTTIGDTVFRAELTFAMNAENINTLNVNITYSFLFCYFQKRPATTTTTTKHLFSVPITTIQPLENRSHVAANPTQALLPPIFSGSIWQTLRAGFCRQNTNTAFLR